MPNLQLRRAAATDVPAVHALVTAAYQHYGPPLNATEPDYDTAHADRTGVGPPLAVVAASSPETEGPLPQWLYHSLKALGVPVVCLDARHARAATALQRNKADALSPTCMG